MPKRFWGISVIAVALLATLPVSAEPPAEWTWQNPLPQGNSFDAVWGRSAGEVYAVGGWEMIMRFNGEAWSSAQRPLAMPVTDIWGLDSGVLFTAAWGGKVLRFDGVDWTEIPTDFTDNLVAILAFSETDIYVAERFPGRDILHYDGPGWSVIGTAPDGIHDLGGSGPGDIYAVGFEGMMTHYDGAVWTPVTGFSALDITSVWSNAADDVFSLQQGAILHHFDGLGWTQVGSDATVSWQSDMWGSSANDLWFVDENGGLSHYDGIDITEYDVPNDGLVGVWGDGLGSVHAVGVHGSLLSFDGLDWTAHSSAVGYEELNAVWGLGDDDLYAVGSLESALHYDGMEWTSIRPTNFSVWFNDVWAAASDEVFVVGKAGILHYDGAEWTPMDDGLRHMLLPHNGVCGFSASDVVAVGAWGAIVRYDGLDWNIVRPTDTGQGELLAVWGAAPDDIWAVGPQNEFLHWDGLAWNSVPVSTPGQVTAIVGWASDDIYALGAGGELFHYDGIDWNPENDLAGQGVTGIHGSSSSDLYAVTISGIVWHHDGVDWTSVDTGARTGLNAIWASAGGDVFVAGNGGSVLAGTPVIGSVPDFAAGEALRLRSEPNPFNPNTTIRFEMPRAGRARLRIHDAAGRWIATLVDREVEAGPTTAVWDGRDASGRRQASGVYFATVRTELGREVRKLTLVK